MAREKSPEAEAAEAEKKNLKEEKKQLKRDQRIQKKEAKRRAKEIARQEDALSEETESNGVITFGATILVVALWLAVICVVIKLDIGGFGSTILTPILQDVPVVNKILPGVSLTETTDAESYGGYTSLRDAVDQIRNLELELERVQTASLNKDTDIENLKAEVLRLQEFEQRQQEFERIQQEFYNEVVYSEKGPGAEAFQKYYESMEPTTAEYIYKQVVMQLEETQEIKDFADAYSPASMKPKQAAGIFESMTDNLNLVARILNLMSPEDRGAILGVMDADVAGKLTKILDPES